MFRGRLIIRNAGRNLSNLSPSPNAKGLPEEKPVSPLLDLFGRNHTYLRISLTERCNLRCQYCMPAEGVKLSHKDQILTSPEIIHLSRIFAGAGVTKIRLTGGEPTVRKDLTSIIESLKGIKGIDTVAMTTNGLVLTRQLVDLQRAGLDIINISLDTMSAVKYEQISRRNGWKRVMMGIDLALQLGYEPVKINCVVMKGVNDDEIVDFVQFTKDRNVDVRFIEYMPFTGNKWDFKNMVTYKDMLTRIKEQFPDFGPLKNHPNDTSKAWKVPGHVGQVGFITSMSEHFCGSCNRLRITADGNLKVCLFGNAEISLRDALRNGCSQDDLLALINVAVKRKKKQHAVLSPLPPHFTPIKLIYALLSRPYSTKATELSHVDASGKASMVDVTSKPISQRQAQAQAIVKINAQLATMIKDNTMKKGDVLRVAQIAGIAAAKKTSDLIPLCHNIPLDKVDVDVQLKSDTLEVVIVSLVRCDGKTGVEMEALTAASVAALTVYDMCKAISHDLIIDSVCLLEKSGGVSGDYRRYNIKVRDISDSNPVWETPQVGPV